MLPTSLSLSLSLSLPCLTLAQSEEGDYRSLDGQARESLAVRFGPAAEAAFEIGKANGALRRREAELVDSEAVERSIESLGRIDASRRTPQEKARIARAWREAAVYTRLMEGPGPRLLELLEKALELDPDNERLQRDVAFERHRRWASQRRQAEAKRVREAIERGEDPYKDLPPFGGDDQKGGRK